MTRVLITDHVFPGLSIEHEVLDPIGADIVVAAASDEDSLVEQVSEVDAVLVCFAPLTERVVDAAAAGGCRVIARYGIGYDNVAVDAASRHGIVVTNVPDYCLDEVADHTMALLLASARGIVQAARAVGADLWTIEHAGIHRIAGRRLALVGLGGIGRRVAARAQVFGLQVVAFDPFVGEWNVPGVARAASLEEAIADAHFVSLHAPATAENHHLIGPATLAQMRAAPVLINTARGALVDLDAVVTALDDGTLSGVALDV